MIHEIFEKFRTDNRMLVVGDFNMSLIRFKTADRLLQNFVIEHKMMVPGKLPRSHTFASRNESSRSQIDYVLCDDANRVTESRIHEFDPINTSTHTAVEAKLTWKANAGRLRRKPLKWKCPKIKWDKADGDLVGQSFVRKLPENFDVLLQDGNVSEAAKIVNNSLIKAINESVPKSKRKLYGPKRCVSKQVQEKIQMSKNLHRIWRDEYGAPGPEHPSSIRRKQCNKELRSMMRQETAQKRNDFYQDVTDNRNNNNFHRLVNKQRQSKSGSEGIFLSVGDNLIMDTVEQVQACVNHYEKLANPDPNDLFDNEYYESIKESVKDIRNLINREEHDRKPIKENDVTKAIFKLKNNKSPDEHGLCSEAFKLTHKYVVPILTKLFNSMRIHRTISDFYKTGVMSSIPKKGKDKKMDTSRRILVPSGD